MLQQRSSTLKGRGLLGLIVFFKGLKGERIPKRLRRDGSPRATSTKQQHFQAIDCCDVEQGDCGSSAEQQQFQAIDCCDVESGDCGSGACSA
jgi:hypothetical protein